MGNYAQDKVAALNKANIQPEMPPQHRKIVSITEKGVNYKVKIVNEGSSVVYPIDGCAIKNGLKCDKFLAVLKDDSGVAVFIELKGKDINHAIAQLEATLNNPLFMPHPSKNEMVRARLVSGGSAGPNSTSNKEFEKARIRFMKKYNVELKRLKNQQFDDLIR